MLNCGANCAQWQQSSKKEHCLLGEKRYEKGGPCWLLQLRQMGTQGVHTKEVLPWLVSWARCAGTRDVCTSLAALHCIKSKNYIPQVRTSSEAGPGTKIIYCIIIHICLWWNIYMRMDDSLGISLEWHEAHLDHGITQTIPPCLLPDIQMIQMFLKPGLSLAGELGPDWAIQALIGRWYTRRGDRRKFFFTF